MLRLTLAQMRRSLGRLTAAGIAIAIGTAFVTATLLAGNVFSRTTSDALTARYGDADLVVVSAPATDERLAAVRATPGVDAAAPLLFGYVQVGANNRGEYLPLLGQAPDPAFDTLRATEGSLAKDSEIALPATTAKRLGVGVGDTVQVTYTTADATDETVEPVRVSGIVDDPTGAWTEYGGAGSATPDDLTRWNGGPLDSRSILVATDDPAATATALSAQQAVTADGAKVLTKQEAADRAMADMSDSGVNFVVMLVLGFAAVALIVAGLVIANTFQVLVAQRTRTLALLRCVGARRSQLRASVLVEAALLGVGASAVGVLAGASLAQVTLWALDGVNTGAGRLPTTIDLSVVTILVPLLVGTLVTIASSFVPARAATRVAPIAALRPADAPVVRSTSGTVRLVLSLVMAVGGLVGLLLSVAAAQVSPFLGLGLGVLSGAVSFVGVLVGAVFWVPKVVGRVGALLARTGSSARLAAANSVRNPRRTAATSTALLIGVTLVALMSTGAASARSSLATGLDQQFPVDLVVTSTGWTESGAEPLPAATMQQVLGVDGVADAVELPGATLESDAGYQWEVVAIEPDRAAQILRDGSLAGDLRDGAMLTSSVDDPTSFVVHAVDGTAPAGTTSTTVKAIASKGLNGTSIVTPTTLAAVAPDAPATTLWVRLDPHADPSSVLNDVRDAVAADVSVQSAGAERRSYEQTIDSLLAIVVGLLGVAVLIALIGVANTLSLSVLERRRESATLRAIGLSKRQLRVSLGVEGMLIAGVGALLGVLLGLVYGWAGSAIVFGAFGDLHLAVPWRDLALVLVVAVVAGLVASVLPARRAARTSPVAALGVE
ncbi:MAG TPA: FtsX-like permease family protein [Cellulomonas sp.]|nr:FtsX-like permease family protein [Cellulomonas sp.]